MATWKGTMPGNGRAARLAENATMRLSSGRVRTLVRVERGVVLVTQQGDLDDHVLEPGDEILLRVGGLAVAWAFTEATISVSDAVNGQEDAGEDAPSP